MAAEDGDFRGEPAIVVGLPARRGRA